MKTLRRAARFFGLSAEERWVFLLSLALLPLMAAALRRFGFNRTRAFLQARAGAHDAGDRAEASVRARRVARMVNAAARYGPYRANCLKRSLWTWWLLMRRGILSDLRIGVRKREGVLEAHAWVEVAGEVINDSAQFIHGFAPFTGDVMSAYRLFD